jgi:hypothetical protein
MAGAKQLVTLGFILVPAEGRTSSRGVLEALYCTHRGARRGGLLARWERRPVLQVLEVLIEASVNIVVKAESVRVSAIRHPVTLRLGDCPSFYSPRRRQFTSVSHCLSACRGMAYSATE